MPTLTAGRRTSLTLQPGKVLAIAAGNGSGSVTRLRAPGAGDPYSPTPFTGAAFSLGPYERVEQFRLRCEVGTLTYDTINGNEIYTLPTLNLIDQRAITINTLPGAYVGRIINVPDDTAPRVDPNDGRFIVLGPDRWSGWKLLRGLAPVSTGAIAISIVADGANPWNGAITVTIIIPPAPTVLNVPNFIGFAQEGQTLTGTRGTYTNSPSSYTDQWQSSADGGATWTNIAGANSLNYLQTTSDIGKVLRRVEVASNAGGSSVANPSAASVVIMPSLPVLPAVADFTVSTRQQFLDAIAAIPDNGPNKNIAVDASILDLGTTNTTFDGYSDMTVTIANKNITLYPKSGYGNHNASITGDNTQYEFERQPTSTIRGFLRLTGTGNVKIYGFRFFLGFVPAKNQRYQDFGVGTQSVLIYIDGTVNHDIQGNQFLGYCDPVTGAGLADLTAKPYDAEAPTAWGFLDVGTTSSLSARDKWYRADEITENAAETPEGYLKFGGSQPAGTAGTNYPLVSRPYNAPAGIRTGTSWYGTGTLRYNRFVGVTSAASLNMGGSDPEYITSIKSYLSVGLNVFDRVWRDDLYGAIRSAYVFGGLDIYSNIFLNAPAGGNMHSNPHADNIQFFTNKVTGSRELPLGTPAGTRPLCQPGFKMRNNLALRNGLGSKQFMFPQGNSAGFEAPVIAYNLAAEPLKALVLSGGTADALIIGNACVTRRGTEVAGGGSFSIGRGDRLPVQPDSKSLVARNILDAFNNGTTAAFGPKASAALVDNRTNLLTASNTVLADVFEEPLRPPTTPNDLFLSKRGKVGSIYESWGIAPFPTLRSLLAAGLPTDVWVGFPDQLNIAPSAVATTNKAYVHGPVGVPLPVTPGPGVEWISYAADKTTVIQAWTSGAGTVLPGNYLQARKTAAALGPSKTDASLTVGTLVTTWSISVPSTLKAPMAVSTAPKLQPVTDSGAARNGVLVFDTAAQDPALPNNSYRFSAVIMFRTPSSVASGANQAFVQTLTGTNIALYFNGLNNMILSLRQYGNGYACNFSINFTFAADTEYKLCVSMDSSAIDEQDDPAAFDANTRIAVTINDTRVNLGTSPAPMVANAGGVNVIDKGFSYPVQSLQLVAMNAGSGTARPVTYPFRMMAIWFDEYINWYETDAILGSTVDYAGPNGEGIAPSGKRPHLFFVGSASELNGDKTANRGTGGKYDNTGVDYTTVEDQPWPPNLFTSATKVGTTSVRVTALGYPKPNVVITATGSVTGAKFLTLPQARDGAVILTGFQVGETVTFTNNGGYTNPAAIVM